MNIMNIFKELINKFRRQPDYTTKKEYDFYENGVIYSIDYKRGGQTFKYKLFSPSGRIKEIHYIKNNVQHRENDKPSCIFFDDDGNLQIKKYNINGTVFRSCGPSIIEYNPDGSISSEHIFFIDNERIQKEEYMEIKEWCDERGIKPTKLIDNIPEEYQVEFKLKFL